MDVSNSWKPATGDVDDRARIVLVEDEGVLADMMRRLLKRWGYEVVGIFATGEEVVSQGPELRPDLVLMDVQLAGGLDGLEAARELVARYPVPLFFMTGYRRDDTEARMSGIGVPWQAAPKPVPFAQLREGIETLLQAESKRS